MANTFAKKLTGKITPMRKSRKKFSEYARGALEQSKSVEDILGTSSSVEALLPLPQPKSPKIMVQTQRSHTEILIVPKPDHQSSELQQAGRNLQDYSNTAVIPGKLNNVMNVNQSVNLNPHEISPCNSPINTDDETLKEKTKERKYTSTLFPSLKPGIELEKEKNERRSFFTSSKKKTENIVLGFSLDDSGQKLVPSVKSKPHRRNVSSLMTATVAASK